MPTRVLRLTKVLKCSIACIKSILLAALKALLACSRVKLKFSVTSAYCTEYWAGLVVD